MLSAALGHNLSNPVGEPIPSSGFRRYVRIGRRGRSAHGERVHTTALFGEEVQSDLEGDGIVMSGRHPLIKGYLSVVRWSWVRSCLRPIERRIGSAGPDVVR